MSDIAIIEAALQNKKLEEIETQAEAAARNRAPSTVVTLTPPIINQVLELLKAGVSIREIKATPVQIGPAGQKWKLSTDQIRAIETARKARYGALLAELEG